MQSYISRECDYAIRITAYLACLKSKPQISVSELSNNLRISKSYAARIVHKLKNSGILKTNQGVFGGVSIGMKAEKISIYDILIAMDFSPHFNDCITEKKNCGLLSICKVHTFLAQQEIKILEEFKKSKISDFAFNESEVNSFKHHKNK